MDARKCKGCNAKEGRLCYSAYLEQPTPVKELAKCPDPILCTLDALDEWFCLLEEAFTKLAKGGKDASSSKE